MRPHAPTGPQRSVCAALVALLTVTALALGSPSPATSATQASQTDRWSPSRIRVVTYNLQYDLPPRVVRSDLRALASTGVAVIALQEMGGANRRAAARSALVDCARCHYATTMPAHGQGATTPIFWRSDRFSLVQSGVRRLTDKTYVGPRGAGPRTVPPKYVTWVLLKELRSGRKIYVLNTHTIASVQAKSGGANPRMARRVRLYTRHLHALRSFVDGLGASRNVVVCGDFNVNYRRDRVVRDRHFPYVNMPRSDLQPSYGALGEPRRGTHTLRSGLDTRLIDYVYYEPDGAMSPRRQRVLVGYRSDHRPLVLRLAIAPKR
jgi:endonuclease/exonuclease/phosphatase family metal-dependent hydrolase